MARNEAKRTPGVSKPPAEPQMFSTLVASKPKREGKAGALAGIFSLVIHVAVVALLFWATMRAGQATQLDEEVIMDILIPEEEAPPPPPPPPPPPMEEAPPPVEVVEPPQGFQTLSPPTVILPDIPPPSTSTFDARDFSGVGVEGGRADGDPDREVTVEDLEAAPRFTPYTVAPQIRNMEEVRRALQRFYPPLLRDAGIGGTTVLWFLIDENGQVVRTQVQESSGHAGLDQAATRVADVMSFSPAMNRDRRVRVWVQLPIEFRPVSN